MYLILALGGGCTGALETPADDDAEVEPPDAGDAAEPGGGTDDASAKLLGYAFGDGNYFPPFPPEADLELTAGGKTLTDFVASACAAGYDGQIYLPNATPKQIDCESFSEASGGNQTARIENFVYPYDGDFERFVNEARAAERRAFMSGFMPLESGSGYNGGPNGHIDDQSVGFGPYTDRRQIHIKMTQLRTLMQNADMADGGFHTAALLPVGCMEQGICDRVKIDADAEACYFNSSYGYRFVNFSRIPGAEPADGGGFVEPPAC